MTEFVTEDNLNEFENFVEGNAKGHFMQSHLWSYQKPDWAWEGIISRDASGAVRGAMSVLIRKVPYIPYKL
ncbi:MAG: methicillin resistance protein, partial [Clostridia bacterium]